MWIEFLAVAVAHVRDFYANHVEPLFLLVKCLIYEQHRLSGKLRLRLRALPHLTDLLYAFVCRLLVTHTHTQTISTQDTFFFLHVFLCYSADVPLSA